MKRLLISVILISYLMMTCGNAEDARIWDIISTEGQVLTQLATEPAEGDCYITSDNQTYRILSVENGRAMAEHTGMVTLPSTEWLDYDLAVAASAAARRIALYCTHSDESYEPSDGYYSTMERGSIYQVAQALADALDANGVEASVAQALHHPHDAGAYRRSRQTAVQLLKTARPDCLIDIHLDGIPDPASYEVTIGGQEASKIRLLVGRGNQNAQLNKDFALMIKAVADRVYPGLIKDIYMGKGAFNQDLLPRSILFECGTYTLEKERVLASMPMMADVLDRALYGGIIGSAGRITTDVKSPQLEAGGVTRGEPDPLANMESGIGSGVVFLLILLGLGVAGMAILSAGSMKRGVHKAGRNLREMTGGLIGKKPEDGEDPRRS